MKKIFLFCISLSVLLAAGHAQTSAKDSIAGIDSIAKAVGKAKRDSSEKAMLAKMTYPYIKSSKWSGVMPVASIDIIPDPNQQYKLVMEATTGIKDSIQAKDINEGIGEVARLLNLHVASGIPKKNIDIIVVAHGGILKAFYTNEKYREVYKVDNPNLPVIKELTDAGVKFIACGQAMAFFNVKKEEMLPLVKIALTAQTAITNYETKGYLLKQIMP